MPKLYMMIGGPGSGKSVYRNQLLNSDPTAIVLSTDDFVDGVAKFEGKQYNEVWKDTIKSAEVNLESMLNLAIRSDSNIIWDQTNLFYNSRKKKLSKIPEHYEKIAIILLTHPDIIAKVNKDRESYGRNIPDHIINNMRIDPIFEDEGFSTVITVKRNR